MLLLLSSSTLIFCLALLLTSGKIKLKSWWRSGILFCVVSLYCSDFGLWSMDPIDEERLNFEKCLFIKNCLTEICILIWVHIFSIGMLKKRHAIEKKQIANIYYHWPNKQVSLWKIFILHWWTNTKRFTFFIFELFCPNQIWRKILSLFFVNWSLYSVY